MRNVLERVANNWQLKLTSLCIAFLLWLSLQSGKPYRYRINDVPVRVSNQDAEWVVSSDPSPARASVEFHGRFRDLLELPSAGVSVVIPVENVVDTAAAFMLRSEWVDLGSGNREILIGAIEPDSVRLSFDRTATRLVALRPRLTGALGSGYELAAPPIIEPAVVRVSGPSRRLARMDTLALPAIDLSGITSFDTITLTIDTVGLGIMVSPRRIRVVMPVQPRPGSQ